MLDFQIKRCTRQCHVSGEQFHPGDVFFSVLVSEGPEVLRRDYSEAAWPGPPEQSLGWWKSRMPKPSATKIHWAPNDILLHYFDQLSSELSQQDMRYVLALLMVRRRILRVVDTLTTGGIEQMVLHCPKNENEYQVVVTQPGSARIDELQQSITALLFKDAA
ncbi:MAG: hypothetical protein VX715_02610 [Planctomycetota bacterium]|jgi:hypothetical protein|nr:hypothetical protein [Planctomycetota bacterium]|tara:strand:+ start:4279 stop:4764 length:486 start_codon:yes stop_codon:yes gene_type:complete